MDLREYLEKTEIPVTRIAERLKINHHKLYNAMRGSKPSLVTILAIENYTRGLVRPIDFLTAEEREHVYQQKPDKDYQAI